MGGGGEMIVIFGSNSKVLCKKKNEHLMAITLPASILRGEKDLRKPRTRDAQNRKQKLFPRLIAVQLKGKVQRSPFLLWRCFAFEFFSFVGELSKADKCQIDSIISEK